MEREKERKTIEYFMKIYIPPLKKVKFGLFVSLGERKKEKWRQPWASVNEKFGYEQSWIMKALFCNSRI